MISSLVDSHASSRFLVALLLVATLAISSASVEPAAASPPEAPAGPTSVVPAGAARLPEASTTVTLVTGDRVTLRPTRDGEPTVRFEPRDPSHPTGFSVRRDRGRVTVIPHDVEALVPDVLDSALFDVTGLVEMRYDDRHRADLPLIVRRSPGARSLDADLLTKVRALGSIGASAGSLDKTRAAAFGKGLAGAGSPVGARSTAGLTKVWLDRTIRASSLDGYLDQVKAPAAWQSGLDGSGVKVAVLDTGVDDGHPALAGQVTSEADFSGGTDTADGNGHGTHVASLIAGTGAGSDGARQGIAPAVDLLSGKVLTDEGYGQWSWLIAGMEWAVSQGADVVNLSLGGDAGSEDDPVVTALDSLTARTGTLFVVAAGNAGGAGPSPFTIGTPGTAASALTVGAVGPNDRWAHFSSKGPTLGSYRLKPDLVAPGVGLLGARAGAREGDLYVPMGGTSQATPLVAGAAALLMQQHPTWTWQRVKAQLVGTADDVVEQTAWSHGGGRLDLAQATAQQLSADLASLDFGYLKHPDEGTRSRALTLTNDSAEPVTVTLQDQQVREDGAVAPAGALTVSPTTLTVPAGGAATATVTLDPGQLDDGLWHGSVTAAAAGQQLFDFPVGLYDEPERYDLSLRVLDRHGAPHPGASVGVFEVETGGFTRIFLDEDGTGILRVTPGHYSIFTTVNTPATAGEPETFTIAGSPEVTVTGDTRYVIDARTAKQLRAPTIDKQPVRVVEAGVTYARKSPTGPGYTDDALFTPAQIVDGNVFVTPTAPVAQGQFEVAFRWRLEPEGKVRPGEPEIYELLLPEPRFNDPLSPHLGRDELRSMARVENTFSGLTAPGRYHVGRAYTTRLSAIEWASWNRVEVPGRRVELLTAHPDALWRQCFVMPDQELIKLCDPQYEPYAEGERLQPVFGTGLHPKILWSLRNQSNMFVEVALADGGHIGRFDPSIVRNSQMRLFQNGTLLGESVDPLGVFPVPGGAGRFRLEHDWTLDPAVVPVANEARTVWEFNSVPPDDPANVGSAIPPMLGVDYAANVDPLGYAAARQALRIDLTVSHLAEPAARVTGARLWYSVDGGTTWERLDIRKDAEGRYRATVPGNVLRPGTDLSLRATATDSAGGSIDQTVIGILPVR
ncbi:S8 family serine peptidase [Micromonospora sp. DT47]